METADRKTFLGIEQNFNEVTLTLESLESTADLLELCGSGLSLEDADTQTLLQLLNVGDVSVESLKEQLTTLYRKLLDTLVSAWDYLVTYADTVFIQTKQLLFRIEEVSDEAKSRSASAPKKQTIDVEAIKGALLLKGKKLDPKEYIQQLNECAQLMDRILLDHVNEVMNASKYISPLVESLMTIDVSKPDALGEIKQDARAIAKFGNEVHDNFVSYRGEDVSAVRSDLLTGNGITSVKKVSSLLGDKALYVKYGSVDKAALRGEGVPFFNAISTVFGSGIVLSTEGDHANSANGEFKTLTPDEVNSVCAALEDIVKVVQKFKIRYDKDIKLQRKRYQQLRNKLSVMAKVDDNAEINLYLRRIGSAAMGLSRWYYDPFVPLINHSLRIVRASLVYSEKSLSQWPVR